MDFSPGMILVVLAILAGALNFGSAVINFVNSRLNEAQTIDAHARVVSRTLQTLSIVFTVVGVAAILFRILGVWPLALFAASWVFQLIDVLNRTGPIPHRGEVLMLCIIFSSFTLFMAVAVSFYFFGETLNLMHQQSDLIGQILKR